MGKYQKSNFLSFDEARAFAHALNLVTCKDWNSFWKAHRPLRIPSGPAKIYESDWKGWPDFLGTSRYRRASNMVSYSEAQAALIAHEITTIDGYERWASSENRPLNIPSNPDKFYKNEWMGWKSFLTPARAVLNHKSKRVDSKQRRAFYRTLQESTHLAQRLCINSSSDWAQKRKDGIIPHDYPSYPKAFYKDEWVSWEHFFGRELHDKKAA